MPVVKRSVSIRPELWDEMTRLTGTEGGRVSASVVRAVQICSRRRLTGTEGGRVSALVNTALEHYLRLERGRAAVAEWEAEHGAFTPDELAEADRILDAAGIPPLPDSR